MYRQRYQGKYRKWAKGEDFMSKLPSDIKKRKAGELEAIRTLDPDLRERVPSMRVAPYSDEAFRRLAIEWLITTNQVSRSAIFKRRHYLVILHYSLFKLFSIPRSKR